MKYIIASTAAGTAKCTYPDRHGNTHRYNWHHTNSEDTYETLLRHVSEIAKAAEAVKPSEWEHDSDSETYSVKIPVELSDSEKKVVGDWMEAVVVAERELDI